MMWERSSILVLVALYLIRMREKLDSNLLVLIVQLLMVYVCFIFDLLIVSFFWMILWDG